MNPALAHRIVLGAAAGSLILTHAEAVALHSDPGYIAAAVWHPHERRLQPLREIPLFVLPDHVAQLPELDPWSAQLHESAVEGLIGHDEARRLYDMRTAAALEEQRIAEKLYASLSLTSEAVAELRRAFGLDDA